VRSDRDALIAPPPGGISRAGFDPRRRDAHGRS
jgi:hypothetical protein